MVKENNKEIYMKNFIRTIIFVLGVDTLGFPNIHTHKLIFGEKFYKKYTR